MNQSKNGNIKILLISIFLIFITLYGILPGLKQANSDFPNYYLSTKLFLSKQLHQAYNINFFNAELKRINPNAMGLFVMYPPATALIMLPFSSLTMIQAKQAWVCFSCIFLVLCIYLVYVLSDKKIVFTLLIFIGAGFNLANDLMLGQVYIFTLFLILLGIKLNIQKDSIIAGLLFGIAASIKFIPLVFIPFLLYKKNYRCILGMICSLLILNSIVVSFAGKEVYNEFINAFYQNYVSKKVVGVVPSSVQYQSMEAFKNYCKINLEHNTLLNSIIFGISTIWNYLWLVLCGICILLLRNKKEFLTISFCLSLQFLLLTEVGSASYHLILLIPVLALIPKLNLFENNYLNVFLFLWFCIGYLPTIYNKLEINNVFFDFNRLWLLSIFSGIFYFTILSSIKKNS